MTVLNKTPAALHYGKATQEPFDVAVVIPSILRPELDRALKSIFAQDLAGRVHILIGIDSSERGLAFLEAMFAGLPEDWLITVLDLGTPWRATPGTGRRRAPYDPQLYGE